VKFANIEYSNLYNRTEAFDKAISENPFLRYSFNTALVMSTTASYNESHVSRRNPNRIVSKRINLEFPNFLLTVPFEKLLGADARQFIKIDYERIWLTSFKKSSWTHRLFLGGGVGFGKDTTLPFFKQYFAGGANSMRGWAVRGIGPGSKSLASYQNNRTLNDRTGDVRVEANSEYRFNIKQIIPNTLVLKGAFFADLGNVWNFRNTNPGGGFDSTQFPLNPSVFSIKDFYKQLGLNVGAGLRFDFTYIVLRVDFGFRIKRPELSENDGWKVPALSFNDVFKKFFKRGENDEYRKWRYENFNFTIGLNYAF
jgi:outer membrane protein insertion porin family